MSKQSKAVLHMISKIPPQVGVYIYTCISYLVCALLHIMPNRAFIILYRSMHSQSEENILSEYMNCVECAGHCWY